MRHDVNEAIEISDSSLIRNRGSPRGDSYAGYTFMYTYIFPNLRTHKSESLFEMHFIKFSKNHYISHLMDELTHVTIFTFT